MLIPETKLVSQRGMSSAISDLRKQCKSKERPAGIWLIEPDFLVWILYSGLSILDSLFWAGVLRFICIAKRNAA